jgi:hypothetical protein
MGCWGSVQAYFLFSLLSLTSYPVENFFNIISTGSNMVVCTIMAIRQHAVDLMGVHLKEVVNLVPHAPQAVEEHVVLDFLLDRKSVV